MYNLFFVRSFSFLHFHIRSMTHSIFWLRIWFKIFIILVTHNNNNYLFVVSSQCFNTFDQFPFPFPNMKIPILSIYTNNCVCVYGVCVWGLNVRPIEMPMCSVFMGRGTWHMDIIVIVFHNWKLLVGRLSFQHKRLFNEPPIPNYFIFHCAYFHVDSEYLWPDQMSFGKNISMHIHIWIFISKMCFVIVNS